MTGVQTCALPILKHWLITELGHDNTKRIHLHGIIWTELTEEQFEKEWGYGWIFFGYEISVKTINYIVKYVTKRDEANPEFNGKIFTSKGIGKEYIGENSFRRHRYQDRFTEETYKTKSGIKTALPMYYKQKNMDRSRTRSPPNYKGREANKVLQQNSYQSRNNRAIQRI